MPIAVMVGWTTWLAAVPGPGTGHSFMTLQPPFTQDLYATTGNLSEFGILGGVAFAPDGRVWSAECFFLGTRLHRFATVPTSTNGSSVHQEDLVVDLRDPSVGGPYPGGAGGCALVNHPDGAMYSSSTAGIWKLSATTGQVIAGPFGHGSNALGIAVDPQTGHLVYVGDDCHQSLDPYGSTCTLWDLDVVTHTSMVFARLARAEFMLIDGLYFDPSGNFLFAAHRDYDFDSGFRTNHNSLQIIKRPTALKPADTPVDDTQSVQLVPMVSEPDGVAFHAGDGFVVTLNESLDCVDKTSHAVVASAPNGLCPATATPIGGTMTRFDFASGYEQPPTLLSTFASGGFRGDLTGVGPDGCIYATQAPLSETGGVAGTRYNNDVETGDNSIVQICGGFVTPPGVPTVTTGGLGGVVFTDTNGNGTQDSGEPGTSGVPVTVTGPDNTPHSATTDSAGSFTVTDLPPGVFTVVVTAPPGTFVDQPTPVTVSGNQTTHVPPVADVPLTTVTGTVTDSNGQPVVGVVVTLTGTNNEGEPVTSQAITTSGGTFSFTLPPGTFTVTEPAGTTQTFTVTVGTPVIVTLASRIGLSCVLTSAGQVGAAYSSNLAATGGVAPYSYSIVGAFPAGLTLNSTTGVISGTPTTAGSYIFTAKVVDATGTAAGTTTENCTSITIAPAALPGKTFDIGPSSMEGHLRIRPGDLISGGYSFKFVSASHAGQSVTVSSTLTLPFTCPQGGGSGGNIVINLGIHTHFVPANNTDWQPTGDANNVLSWSGSGPALDGCSGNVMDNSVGAIFETTVSQNPNAGQLLNWRFKYRDPNAKGKGNVSCVDTTDPRRNRADVCGASWSQTVKDP